MQHYEDGLLPFKLTKGIPMDTSKVILSRCQFSNIGLHHLLSETFRKEKVISFDNQQNLFPGLKRSGGALFTLYLVLPDSIYSNIIYFHWLISLRKKRIMQPYQKLLSPIIRIFFPHCFPAFAPISGIVL